MMSYTIYDFLGIIGVFLILTMYLAIQMGKTDSASKMYSLLNALGAILILVSLYFQFNLSAVVIESFWLIISIYGLMKKSPNRIDKL